MKAIGKVRLVLGVAFQPLERSVGSLIAVLRRRELHHFAIQQRRDPPSQVSTGEEKAGLGQERQPQQERPTEAIELVVRSGVEPVARVAQRDERSSVDEDPLHLLSFA